MSAARNNRLRILFAASEAVPWAKTGGLAEVANGLPRALAALGHDVRLLTPAYADTLANHSGLKPVRGFRPPLAGAGLLAAPTDADGLRTWLLTLPGISDRPGNPYQDDHGAEWRDNWRRFGELSRLAALLAGGRAGMRWRADILHCNDWQTGLAPVFCMLERIPAATVFTVHNLHYRGLFPAECMTPLGLPPWLWHHRALEFHGRLAFIKGGLVFADELTTVSPTYAEEIRTSEHGHGLDGLLRERRACLTGILNGIDDVCWDPARDKHLPARYDRDDLSGKAVCKTALQRELGLEGGGAAPLLGLVSRLVTQKGIDLILTALPGLLERGCQLAVLGRGDTALEAGLRRAAAAHPGRVGLRLDFDEGLAHRIEAGADLFLMPSRFEPCGLNQMYSQRYGTPPVVHRSGGLADSVTDATPAALAGGNATGFVFAPVSAPALLSAVDRALALFREPHGWRRLQRAGMARDFGWRRGAEAYLDVYGRALRRPRTGT